MVDDVMVQLVGKIRHLPERKNKGDAGADLRSRVNIIICPGKTERVPAGLKICIPYGYVGLVFPRSGLAARYGLRLANCVGVVDSGYRGEVIVPLYNDSDEVQTICEGDRIAQLLILKVELPQFMAVEDLPESERGEGGFGSTGVRE